MRELTNARGIEYYHFLQPNQYDPGSKPLSDWERHHAVLVDHPYRAAAVEAYPLLREAGRELVEEGAAFEDLSRLFIDVTDTLYIDNIGHFNKQGNRLMLKAIAEKIGATSAEATSSSIPKSVP
jgi:hypothetical protein